MTSLSLEQRHEVAQLVQDQLNLNAGAQMPAVPRQRIEEELEELQKKLVSVEEQIRKYEEKIAKLESARETRVETKKGMRIADFVNKKQMCPSVLKDATGFKLWRETFMRWVQKAEHVGQRLL